jgi:hypothetical protein
VVTFAPHLPPGQRTSVDPDGGDLGYDESHEL